MTSISGKTEIDWQAFRATLGDIAAFDTPSVVKKRSRDFFWYSPILARQLSKSFGDLVVMPGDEAELALCIQRAVEWNIPVVARGGGTGNYGQAVPLDGGLVIDMTGMDRVVAIGDAHVEVQAGCRIAVLNTALRSRGRELPIYPSTEALATIGGFIAGGSGGVGSIAHGMLRDRGNIASATVLSIEKQPKRHVFAGDAANIVHHAWGLNGIIVEIGLRTVPACDWVNVVASFAGYRQAFEASIAVANDEAIELKLLSTIDARIAAQITPIRDMVGADRDLMLALVAPDGAAALRMAVEARGGRVDVAASDDTVVASGMPPVIEFSYNHTTLQILKTDRTITYLQARVPAPLDPTRIDALRAVFGTEVLMHHEFALLDGELVAFDLPIVRYTSDERLREIMSVYEAHGCPVADAHTCLVEGGAMKSDFRHLAWKKRLDPNGLLNSAKSGAWNAVKHLSAEEIECL